VRPHHEHADARARVCVKAHAYDPWVKTRVWAWNCWLKCREPSADSSWLEHDLVKYEIAGMWFQSVLDRRYCRRPGAQRGSQIIEFAKAAARMPLMSGVHDSMRDDIDSGVAADACGPEFPHLYEHARSPACLLLRASSEQIIDGNEEHFKQRIQGIRHFAEAMRAFSETADPRPVNKVIGTWKDSVRKACQELEPGRRVTYQLFCLESFAVLFPQCAKFLHREYTRNSKCMESTALFDLFQLCFLDMFSSADISASSSGERCRTRLLEARFRCVPAALLGIMQVDCDRRIAEVFRSLFELLLQKRGEGAGVDAARNRAIQEAISVLVLRGSASEGVSDRLLRRLSFSEVSSTRHVFVARAALLGKLLLRCLFSSLSQESLAGATNGLVKACAAANAIKCLLKSLGCTRRHSGNRDSRADSADSQQLAVLLVEELIHLAAKQLAVLTSSNPRSVVGFWLLSIANAALALHMRLCPANSMASTSAATGAPPSLIDLSRPALVRKSLRVIMFCDVMAFCEAFPPAHPLGGNGDAPSSVSSQVSENLSFAATELENEPAAAFCSPNALSGLSQKILHEVLVMGHLVDESRDSDISEVEELSDSSVAEAEIGRAALKVLKKILTFGDTALREALLGCVAEMSCRVSKSIATEMARSPTGARDDQARALAQRRVSEWAEFLHVTQLSTTRLRDSPTSLTEGLADGPTPSARRENVAGAIDEGASRPASALEGLKGEVPAASDILPGCGSGAAPPAANLDEPAGTMALEGVDHISDSETED